MRKNLYEAFTLVEMLIVMGILIILMAVGITAGRFAINRANDVAHQNAADQIYTALQAYYTDNREFPTGTTGMPTPHDLVTVDLAKYMDNGTFNGGTEATFSYTVSTDGQVVLICVSKGGIDDAKKLGYYCNGNGFTSSEVLNAAVTSKDITYGTGADYVAVSTPSTTLTQSDWDGKTWQ